MTLYTRTVLELSFILLSITIVGIVLLISLTNSGVIRL